MAARILITREEQPGERQLAAEMDLELAYAPMIRVTLGADITRHAPRATHHAFTSRNAVEALRAADLLRHLEGSETWCVGPATAAALGGIPHHVSPGTTGQDLARFMLEQGVKGDIMHICGDPRRPELKQVLEAGGCRVKEWVVYRSEPVDAELPEGDFHAVAFFSPSAVRQFKALGWDALFKAPYVAIGPTTASELLPILCSVSRGATFRDVLETARKMLKVEF